MKPFFLSILFISLIFLSCDDLIAQDFFTPPENKPEIHALKIQRNLKIDGILDEKEWADAKEIKLNFQVEPYQGQEATYPTIVKLAYNENYLYVAAINYDHVGKNKYRAPDLKRDYLFNAHDNFGLAIDAFNDKRNAMVFQTNAYGSLRDLLSFDDRQFDPDWDGLYKARTQRTDEYWIAEMMIPWQTLRFPKSDGKTPQDWGINFYRNRRTANETIVWAAIPRSMSALRMDYAGILKEIVPPVTSTTNIRFNPYYLNSYTKSQGTELDNVQGFNNKLGGEIKWAIDPKNVVDFTANTDFAQADVDRQVNNITRFSVFFPERRQFFLENASLFGFGLAPIDDVVGGSMIIQPFFSRKIGLDENVNPVPINTGLRYVHRSEKFNYGAIAIQQGAADGVDHTNFGVGRFSTNFSKQNRIGWLSTYKQDPNKTFQTHAVDAFIRITDVLSFSGMVSTTANSLDNSTGLAEYAQFYYRDNKYLAYWTQTYVNKNYDPAVGFVSRSNILSNSQGISRNIRSPKLPKWIRSIEPGIYTEVYHSLNTGDVTEGRVLFTPSWVGLQNGGALGLYTEYGYQNLEETFSPLGIDIEKGEYSFLRKGIFVNTDQSNKISLNGFYEVGPYFDGKLNWLMAGMKLAPIPHINFGFTLSRNEFIDIGKNNESKTVNLIQIENRFAINPRVQLIGFYQRNTSNDLNSLNMRISIEYKPLSFIYIVFNKSSYLGDDETEQSQSRLLSKISYIKQF